MGRSAVNLDELRNFVQSGAPELSKFPAELCLYSDRVVQVFYAPVEHHNPGARLVLLGLTPGLYQAQQAVESFAGAMARGASVSDALAAAKYSAAFGGPIRANLCAMLQALDIPFHLGVQDADSLFVPPQDRVHLTSALRYPVFRSGRNYSGTPPPNRHPELRRMIESVLGPELASVPSALIVPLGKAAQVATDHLTSRKELDPNRVLRGFPHPSGANGHRRRQFEENFPAMRSQVAKWFSKSEIWKSGHSLNQHPASRRGP